MTPQDPDNDNLADKPGIHRSRLTRLGMVTNQPVDPETVPVTKSQLAALHARIHEAELERGQLSKLAELIGSRYYLEIGEKEPQHQTTAVDAAIHYMGVERRRWRIRVKYLMDSITRLGRRG